MRSLKCGLFQCIQYGDGSRLANIYNETSHTVETPRAWCVPCTERLPSSGHISRVTTGARPHAHVDSFSRLMALGTIAAISSIAASGLSATRALSDGGGGGDSGPNRGSRLRRLFEDRVERLRQESPADSTSFKAGLTALEEQNEQQEEQDEAAAAARGLTGSQFELAQQGNRARSFAMGAREVASGAERRLAQDRQSALRGLLEATGLEEDIASQRRRREDRRRSRLGQIAGSALQSGTQILAANQMGGGG